MLWSGRKRRQRKERRAREQEVLAAAHMVRLFRNPGQNLWDVVALAATGEDADLHWAAGGAVAEAGHAVGPHADRFAAFVARPPSGVGPRHLHEVLLALAGIGDPRAVPLLRAALERGANSPVDEPRFAPTLAVLPAAELVPSIRTGLRLAPRSSHRLAIDALALWGADAAPATPELIAHLHTPNALHAARALGRIGPGAAAAADLLADLALGRSHPPVPGRHPGPHRRHGAQTAAWAHWRITGDDSLALAVCGAAVEAGVGRPVFGHLADLGPAAAGHADAVRKLLGSAGAWTRVGAAHAWWRITGDAGEAVPVLLGALEPDRAGHPAYPTLEVVRLLGAIGAPAAAARPALAAMLAAERRIAGNCRTGTHILEDEELRRSLTGALEHMGS